MITALSGTSRLRNTAIRSRNLSTRTAPMTIVSREARRQDTSLRDAVSPPTHRHLGAATRRESLIAQLDLGSALCDCGERWINRSPPHRPTGWARGGDTAATSRRRAKLLGAEVSVPFGNSAARMSGPVESSPARGIVSRRARRRSSGCHPRGSKAHQGSERGAIRMTGRHAGQGDAARPACRNQRPCSLFGRPWRRMEKRSMARRRSPEPPAAG